MKQLCIICEKKPGNPSFCEKCSKKSWKTRLKAIREKGSNYNKKIKGRKFGRPKFGSEVMKRIFGDNND